MGLYIFGQAAVAVFAITGVLASVRKDRDLLGLVILGMVTALGGGTLRDMILGVKVFWIDDTVYLAVSAAAAAATFFLMKITIINEARSRLLLYFDALGVAFFCIFAFEKTINLGHPFSVAIIMSFFTGMAGGAMRDVISGRPNLLLTKELYATPPLTGSILYGILRITELDPALSGVISVLFIFLFRSAAIYFRLHMPEWLVNQRDHEH